ncbi:MAG TPA: hypothetical protein VGR27_03935, partial [Longimicrobiaceae bacterium]|nr:hypothetical protein [Longimicrobiaceae bacterium]
MAAPPQTPLEDHPVDLEPEAATTHRRSLRQWSTGAGLITFLILLWIFAAGEPPEEGQHLGFRSVLPALVTLLLVFLTREVVSSLFVGIAVGGIVSGQLNIIQSFLIPAIGSASYATILLVYLWALGGLIGLWTRTGGARDFAEWAGRGIVRGPRSARFFAWLMGMVFHQGGT